MSPTENKPSIVTLAGSTRRDSYNRRLVRIAAEGARRAGAEVAEIDLAELALPLFDQDLEAAEGLPEAALRLRATIAEADGLLIASPEYNSSLTGVLKNAIDWASRRSGGGGEPVAAFSGKAAAIMSAAPGSLGGLRGLSHLRDILRTLGVLVLPDQKSIGAAGRAFAEDGSLIDERQQRTIEALGEKLTRLLQSLR